MSSVPRIKRSILTLLADGQRRSLSTICDRTDAFMPVTCTALRQLSAEGKVEAILSTRPGRKALRFYEARLRRRPPTPAPREGE
jgi:hypothetical protein